MWVREIRAKWASNKNTTCKNEGPCGPFVNVEDIKKKNHAGKDKVLKKTLQGPLRCVKAWFVKVLKIPNLHI